MYDPSSSDNINIFPEYEGKVIKIPYRGFFIIIKVANHLGKRYMYDEMYILDSKSIHVTDKLINKEYYQKIRPTGDNLNKLFIILDKYIDKLAKEEEQV